MSSKKLPEQPGLIKVGHLSQLGVLAFLLNAGGSHNFLFQQTCHCHGRNSDFL
jgi:hypothetical protein